MERQHKLGLLLGFAILMVAGILISDHFSRARRGSALPTDITQVPPPGIGTIREPELTQLPPEREPELPDERRAEDGPLVKVKFTRPDENDPLVYVQPAAKDELDPSVWNPKNLKVSKGTEKSYSLAQGDTLYSICKKHYNDGNLYPKLAAWNEEVLDGKLTGLRLRTMLKLPPKDVLMGEAVLAPSGAQVQEPRTSPLPAEDDSVVTKVTTRVYRVVDGDTGVKIAEKALGNKTRWPDIAKLNPGVDPRTLRIGAELKLPPR
ncbi:MAG: LysM peptidoglycan-binding domain-containing protein [Phycisphaerales bacterium]